MDIESTDNSRVRNRTEEAPGSPNTSVEQILSPKVPEHRLYQIETCYNHVLGTFPA